MRDWSVRSGPVRWFISSRAVTPIEDRTQQYV
jgi:hypothetical protein